MARPKALRDRDGFKEQQGSPVARAVRELRERFGLVGVVLIDFTTEHVGVCSSGCTPEFDRHMNVLGARILAAINDGHFPPLDDEKLN